MKKRAAFLLAIVCALSLTGCGMAAKADDVRTSEKDSKEENTISVDLDDVATVSSESDKNEQYSNYLARVTEQSFINEEEIEAADATVIYDQGTEQYSIKLSLKTNRKVDEGQIEEYKTFLSKTYAKVTLVVDGEVV